MHPFLVMEAIHSTALEHAEGCTCMACRAADGDKDAISAVFLAVFESEQAKGPTEH